MNKINKCPLKYRDGLFHNSVSFSGCTIKEWEDWWLMELGRICKEAVWSNQDTFPEIVWRDGGTLQKSLSELWITDKCSDFFGSLLFYSVASTYFDTCVSSSRSSSMPVELHANRMQWLRRLCIIHGYVSYVEAWCALICLVTLASAYAPWWWCVCV
jgi:hypothetical protein